MGRILLVASADGVPFDRVPDLRILLYDAAAPDAEPLASFDIRPETGEETALICGELYRRGEGWKFRALGEGYSNGLQGLATDFGISVDESEAQEAGQPAQTPAAPAVSPAAPTAEVSRPLPPEQPPAGAVPSQPAYGYPQQPSAQPAYGYPQPAAGPRTGIRRRPPWCRTRSSACPRRGRSSSGGRRGAGRARRYRSALAL